MSLKILSRQGTLRVVLECGPAGAHATVKWSWSNPRQS
ncbi:TPA_asm: hypothetical protein [Microviridae sp.]|nr:TPA_asm: hypothetical protein [Microviridae sp.]